MLVSEFSLAIAAPLDSHVFLKIRACRNSFGLHPIRVPPFSEAHQRFSIFRAKALHPIPRARARLRRPVRQGLKIAPDLAGPSSLTGVKSAINWKAFRISSVKSARVRLLLRAISPANAPIGQPEPGCSRCA